MNSAAFAVRQANFADEIDFYTPGLKRYATSELPKQDSRAFLPVSLTGGGCALQCDHCAARIIQPMFAVTAEEGLFDLCARLAAGGTRGVLISGGSDRTGAVPFKKHLPDIARVKRELDLQVIVHTGLIREEAVRGLSDAAVDGAMIDIIGADETIRDVYHLPARVADFERSLELLAHYRLSIIPHIVLGLHYGHLLGEDNALRIISRYPVSALILVVLTPLVGTKMEGLQPPPPDEVLPFFGQARMALPEVRVMLGCARPLGSLKAQLDRAAVDSGFNGIAYPAEGVVAYAGQRGLTPRFFDSCCSIV
ncbi:MAG: radical SAM protein [Chloroflexota bacterium]|nr:radical SAM protein [Chloroflexota bacterium]